MKKVLLFAASLMVGISAFAEWVLPAPPAITQMEVGKELYLYNSEANGYLVGANEWGTRASVSPTLGHKVYIQNGTVAGSYYITNYVLDGWMADQIGYMFMDGFDAIYVDNTIDGKTNNQYSLEFQSDGTYLIGLSEANETYVPKDFPGAYLGLKPTPGDTRLYICDSENTEGYQMADCQLTWYFVSPDDYATHTAAMKQYLAAVSLGETIKEADAVAGVDADVLAASKTLYNNPAATPEELDAQRNALEAAIKNAKFNVATVDNPVELLTMFGIATDFNDSQFTGWESTTGAENKQASNGNAAADYNVTGNHYENWRWEAFTTGKVYAKLTGLPKGVYHLTALAFTNTVGDTYLFAGECEKLVTSSKIDISQPMDIYTAVADDELEIGLDVQKVGTNWIGLDNVYLYYLGDAEEAHQLLIEETLDAEPDYEALFAEGKAFCQKTLYVEYQKARDNLRAEDDADRLMKTVVAFNYASKALASSVAAYDTYYQLTLEAEDFVSSTASESEEVILLSDYLYDETAAEGEYNGNGGKVFILENGFLDNDQILAEAAYLDGILREAKANAKVDGDDCTDLLKNPNFAEAGGWTSVVGPTWPEGNTELFPVMQASNMVCNVYQELTSLQNGLYEFNLQAAFRPGEQYSEENEAVAQAYAYINSFETKVPSGAADNINDASAASTAFADGKYPVKVYGLVTDGTMKVGVTNKVRSVESCILWAGGATLIYRAKNEEVLAQVIAEMTPKAQAMLDNYAGTPELNALSEAIDVASGAEDGYAALIDMKNAMEAVELSTAAYTNLAVALKSLSDAIETAQSAAPSTLKAAQALLEEAQAAYDAQSYSTAEAEQAISDLNAAVVSLKMGGGNASEDNPVDYTDMIVNPNFDPERGDKNKTYIEGWTTSALNGYKEYTASYNRAIIDLHQKLTGLPRGNYKVTVHTYYRAGYWNEEEAYIKEGTETHLTTFYAATSDSTYSKPCLNLTEGATDYVPENAGNYYTLSDGRFAPDGTKPTAAWFAAGEYLNELRFYVGDDGEVTIGLSKTEILPNDYQVVGAWNLYYMGDEQPDTLDVTELIINPNFDPERGDKNKTYIEGWTTSALNGYKEYTASYNRATIDLHQDLSGLPEGHYIVTVHTYYRAGYWNEEEAYIKEGTETHLTTFYAATSDSTYSKPCLNLTEGATDYVPENAGNYYTLSSGRFAPDGTKPTAAWFAAGEYLNTLDFFVPADGNARIGLSKTEILPNDYQVVGAWNLYYLGKEEVPVTLADITSLIDEYLTEGSTVQITDITALIDRYLEQ